MEEGGRGEDCLGGGNELTPGKAWSNDQHALGETVANGGHANKRGATEEKTQTLIIGAGPIGRATLEFVRLTGAKVTVMDRVANRLEFCRTTYGVAHTLRSQGDDSELEQILAFTNGPRSGLFIDAPCNPPSMSHALRYVAPT